MTDDLPRSICLTQTKLTETFFNTDDFFLYEHFYKVYNKTLNILNKSYNVSTKVSKFI